MNNIIITSLANRSGQRVISYVLLIGLALSAYTPITNAQELTLVPGLEILNDIVDVQHNSLTNCVLNKSGSVYCWGRLVGLFGNGLTRNRLLPSNDANYEKLNAALNNDIAAISLGKAYLCGIGKTSGVACELFSPGDFPRSPGIENPPEPNAAYTAISSLSTASQANVCAIQTDNRTVCWGSELSVNALLNNVPAEAQYLKQLDVQISRGCGIDLNDDLVCWGNPISKPVDRHFGSVDPNTIDNIKQVSLGPNGACVIESDDKLSCYNKLSRATELFNDRTLKSVNVQTSRALTICFEELSGSKGCETIVDVDEGNATLRSILPESANPLLVSLRSGLCFVSSVKELQCFADKSQIRNQFPSALSNAQLKTYSPTSVELFWDRASDLPNTDNVVSGYEIYKNDELITVTNIVTSYFDNQSDPQTEYRVRPLRGEIAGPAVTLARTTDADADADADVDAPNFSGTSRYSSNTVELFWDRTPGALTNYYEISRNGEVLNKQLDALSYVDNQAASDTTWVYELIAVDLNGNRSSANSITIAAENETTPTEPTEPSGPTNSDTISAPVLTSEVYSSTSIEIFWNRSNNPNVRYNVFRDNVPVLSNTDALSFYDSDLSPGTSYNYSVAAVLDGNTVAASANTYTTRAIVFVDAEPKDKPLFSGATRYSTSSVEIFWARTPNVLTVYYELSRNGEIINSQLDALSYFDNRATEDEKWTYALVAVDAQGKRSEPATISIDPGFTNN